MRQGMLNVADLRDQNNFCPSVGGQQLKTIAGIYFNERAESISEGSGAVVIWF